MRLVESSEERKVRYKRLAIAAAAAAARASDAGVQTGYLLLAESWSTLAEAESRPRSDSGFGMGNETKGGRRARYG